MPKKPAPIILVAVPTGKRAKIYTSDAAGVFVSTYTEKAGRTTYVVMCGFSVTLDRSDAFDPRYLSNVIAQFHGSYGRGWKFQACDVDGSNPRAVVAAKSKKKGTKR